MELTFPPDVEQFIQNELACKQYHSRDELLLDAVRVLRENKTVTNGHDQWFLQALEQFQALSELPDGWDSDSVSRLDAGTVRAGENLLYRLWKATSFPKPHINPTRTGGVQFEWEVEDRYLEVEILADNKAHCFFQDESAGVEVESELADFNAVELASTLRRLLKGGWKQHGPEQTSNGTR